MTADTLDKEIRRLRQQKDRLEDAERIADADALIGRCFKYRNSYSCPSKPSDYWWLYAKIVGRDRRGMVTVVTAERDRDGQPRLHRDTWNYPHSFVRKDGLATGYVPITEAEFTRGWNAVIGAVDALTDLVKK